MKHQTRSPAAKSAHALVRTLLSIAMFLAPLASAQRALAQQQGTSISVPPGQRVRVRLDDKSADATVGDASSSEITGVRVVCSPTSYVQSSVCQSSGVLVSAGTLADLSVTVQQQGNRRTLLLYGHNLLPALVAGPGSTVALAPSTLVRVTPTPLDPLIRYSVIDAVPAGRSIPPDNGFARLWEHALRLANSEAEPAARVSDKLDRLLVEVDLRDGALPGLKTLSIASIGLQIGLASGQWLLDRGTGRAQISFVRQINAEEVEQADRIYIAEAVKVEVRTVQAIDVAEIPIVLGRNGTPISFDNAQVVVATRTPSDPRVYHSQRIEVFPENRPPASFERGVLYHRASPGDHFYAKVANANQLIIQPASAKAEVARESLRAGSRWISAIQRAARAKRLTLPPDLRTAAGQPIDRIFASRTEVKLGHLAAALILRDDFVGMMKEYQAQLPSIDDEVALRGFRELVRPQMAASDYPLGKIMVYPPSGSGTEPRVPFRSTFDRDFITGRAISGRWVDDATRSALAQYSESVAYAISKAEGIKDYDVEGLLQLVAVGFGPVVDRVVPSLMKQEISGYPPSTRWSPDIDARFWVNAVSSLGQELLDNKAVNEAEWQVTLAVFSLIPFVYPAGLLRTILSLGIGAVDLADVTANQIPEWFKNREELEFAKGAAVLAPERLSMAELKDTPFWGNLLAFAGAGGGIRGDVLDAVAGVDMRAAREIAGRLFRQFEQGGWDAVRRMPKADQAALLALMGDAKLARAADPEVLTDLQRRALAAAARLPGGPQPLRDPATVLNEVRGATSALDDRLRSARAQLASAPQGSPEARRAKELVDSLELRRTVLSDLLKPDSPNPHFLGQMTNDDVRFLHDSGVRLTLAQEQRLRTDLIERYGGWAGITKAFNHGDIPPHLMHQLGVLRKREVDGLLDEVMGAVDPSGLKLKRKAFGSTNPTSDYDISIEGDGAERVVAEFNRRYRERFGKESGTILDTNIYTDPVYNIFRGEAGLTPGANLSPGQTDAFRQFIYDQMATRKYLDDSQWRLHAAAMRNAAPDELRPVVENALAAAERRNNDLGRLIEERTGRLAGGGLPAADPNTVLRARNEIYAETLADIDLVRGEARRLKELGNPDANVAPVNAAVFARYGTEYRNALTNIEQATRAGDLARANSIRDQWLGRFGSDLRNRQGEALYFASEAYQTEGAIAHVVGELQKNKKPITLATLTTPPNKERPGRLPDRQYLNSFYENRANMFKELNHVPRDGARFQDESKAAAKAAKYFIRQLDAANEAGVDLNRQVPRALIELVLSVDNGRSSLDNVAKALSAAGVSGTDFVRQVEGRSHLLSALILQRSSLIDAAPELNNYLRRNGNAF